MTASLNVGLGLTPAAIPAGHAAILQVGDQFVALATSANPCLPPEINQSEPWPQVNAGDTLLVTGLWTPGNSDSRLTITTDSGSLRLNPTGANAFNATIGTSSVGACVSWFKLATSYPAGEWTASLAGAPGHFSVRVMRNVNSGDDVNGWWTSSVTGPFDPVSASGTYTPPEPEFCTYGIILNARTESVTVPGVYAYASGFTPDGVAVHAGAFTSRRGQGIPWSITGHPEIVSDLALIQFAQMTRPL